MAENWGSIKHLFRTSQGIPNINRFSIEGLEGLLRRSGFDNDVAVGDDLPIPMGYGGPGGDPWQKLLYSDKRVGAITYERFVDTIQGRIAELRPTLPLDEPGWPFQTENPIQYPDRVSMALATGSRSPYRMQQAQGPARFGLGGLGRGMMGGGGQTGNIWGMMGTNRASAFQSGQGGGQSPQPYNRVIGAYSQSGPQYNYG